MSAKQDIKPNQPAMQDAARTKTITKVIILTSFCSSFLGSAVNIVVPRVSADLSVSAASVGWVITVYSLATCAFSVPFGKLADVTGRNRIFLLGLSLLGAACLADFFVPNFPAMLALRALQGIGAAMIFATNTAIITSCHSPQQRGSAIGKMLTGTYAGLASGPVLSGVLNHWLGWKSIFLAVALAVLISLVPALRHLPVREDVKRSAQTDGKSPGGTGKAQPGTPGAATEAGPTGSGDAATVPHEQRPAQDIAGNLLFVAMILCAMYGFASVGSGWLPWVLIGIGLLLGVFFVWTELRAADPVIDVRIFRSTPAYTFSNLAALFNYCAIFGISYFVSLYLQIDLGFSSQTAGLILISTPLMMTLLTTKAGAWSDRIAPYKLATTGMAISAACLIYFSFLRQGTPLWATIMTLLVAGLGSAIFSSPNTNAIMSCVDRANYGVASSVLATMRTLGQTSGIAITTIVVSAHLGSQTLQQAPLADFEATMHTAFRIFAVICIIGMFMSMKRRDV